MQDAVAIYPEGKQALFERLKYAPAVCCGDFIIVSGQVGVDENGVVEDTEAQIRLAFAKVAALLEHAGAGLAHIVELRSFHVDMPAHEALFQRIRGEIFSQPPYPAYTGLIEVQRLGMPGLLVEIGATAYLPRAC